MTSFGSDCIRALMRVHNLDSAEIARRIGCAEASVWNVLVNSESAAIAAGRLAHVRAAPPRLPGSVKTSPAFSPVVVRDMGRKAEGVDEIKLTGNVLRQACRLVVHRDVSGGIGKPQ